MKNPLLEIASRYSEEEGTCLLYSGGSRDTAERSFLGLFPDKILRVDNPWNELELEGRWIGFLSYEAGHIADKDVQLPVGDLKLPVAWLVRPTVWYEYDHRGRVLVESVNQKVTTRLLDKTDDEQSYCDKIEVAKEAIRAGEIYQMCLSHQITLESTLSPFQAFLALATRNPASFSGFMQLGEHQIVSSSPERLVSQRNGVLETRPIKGTAPRGKTAEEDDALRLGLIGSEKDQAELLMITDLMRNDLGRVCSSVETKELFRCEAYQNVFHLVSRIQGSVKPGTSALQVLRALFPGGSISGCPKLRAMQVIQELEQRSRGIYCGSMGLIQPNGDFDWNICIRTLLATQSTDGWEYDVQLGGAITADSDPKLEWEETLHKGKTIFEIFQWNP